MCREHSEDSHPHRVITVLLSDKFYWSKFCGNFTVPPYSKLSQKSQRQHSKATMACSDLCSGNGSEMRMSSSKASTDICPYCRSSSDCMCSQLSKSGKLSRDTHHQTFPHLHRNFNSQLQEYSSRPCVGHVPSDLCRCAKTVTNSRNPSTTRAKYCSATDGWRAFRLILLGILVVLPTSTMSSPINVSQRSPSPHSSGHHSHHQRPMKWINPCRIPASLPTQPSESHMQTQSDEEIFQNIVTQARKAELQARGFFREFEHASFGTEHHNYGSVHYDWLADVSSKVDKNLGEPLSSSRLETLEVEDILKSMYRGLQKLAVGLEEVVLDQAIYYREGEFYRHFHEAEFQLKYVLCEFQIAMMEKNIQYEDVTREIMDREKFTDVKSNTVRTIRDFTIFRDYLNTLEFIRDSFEHFRNQAKQSR